MTEPSSTPIEYAQSTLRSAPRWSLRQRLLIAASTLLLIAVGGFITWRARRTPTGFVLDADVPGTEVYLYAQKLGVVPLRLTPERLAELGLTKANPAPAGPIDFDGWGEGAFLGVMDDEETKLMFKVPDAVAVSYLEIETPWGRRTKTGQKVFSNGRVQVQMNSKSWGSVVLTLTLPSSVSRLDHEVAVQVSAVNSSNAPVQGFRPELTLYWGTLHTPWRFRSNLSEELASTWASFAPGQTMTTTLKIPTPNVAEDYTVFAKFDLFANQSNDILAGNGITYSESKLLKVR